MAVTNDLVSDQRVHKVATSLLKMGAEVLLIGRLLPWSLSLERPYATFRMKLFFKKGALFYAEYNFRLFWKLLFQSMDVIVANDLDTLPACFLVSAIRRKKLVYDTHEYYTGVPELQQRPFIRKIWETIESWIFPHLKHIMTVNDSIASLYQKKYHQHLHVVRNVSLRYSNGISMSRKDLDLPEDKFLVILQGAGINVDRGAEEAIEAITHMENTCLLIIGGGDIWSKLQNDVRKRNLQEKVLFRSRMPYEQMMLYTKCSDLGLTLDKDNNINYRYSLPNKLFDYIQAEIPILCTDLVEVANIVRNYNIGEVTPSLDPVVLSTIIYAILHDSERLEQWKLNLAKAAEDLCWEKEEENLLNVYHFLKQN